MAVFVCDCGPVCGVKKAIEEAADKGGMQEDHLDEHPSGRVLPKSSGFLSKTKSFRATSRLLGKVLTCLLPPSRPPLQGGLLGNFRLATIRPETSLLALGESPARLGPTDLDTIYSCFPGSSL
jgi:hypothetical protein